MSAWLTIQPEHGRPIREPPAGSSLGLYAKQPGVPAPIQLKPGKTTTISVTLDDSFKKKE